MFQSFWQVFRNRKMAALLFFGFSSGLPLYLTSKTLQAWMTLEKIDLKNITWFSLVALPYSLKFIWSPLLDTYIPPFLGRRRGWLLIAQIGLVLAIGAMSFQSPSQTNLTFIAINAFILVVFSATQDIAVDAYRNDILEPLEIGAGVSIYVLGYRLALLVTGSLAFILADHLPWSQVYLCLAGVMLITSMVSLWSPEPVMHSPPPIGFYETIHLPFLDFFERQGLYKGRVILVFIVLYKLGDALVNNLSTPFLLMTGFSQTDIGAINGGAGLLATILGTLIGSVLLSRWGINRSLWIFGCLQAFSNLTYLILSYLGKNYAWMVLTVITEHFAAGLSTAAFLGFLMALCNPRFSATQFALLSSLMALGRDILVSPAGWIADKVGWPMFFLITVLAAVPALLLLPICAPWGKSAE